MKHQRGAEVWEQLVIVPKLWKTKPMCSISSDVLPVSLPDGSLARGHAFMFDLDKPLPGSRSRSAVCLQGTWTPGSHQESTSRSCWFSLMGAKPHTGSASVPGPGDSVVIPEKKDLRPESEGLVFLLWVVFPPGCVFNFLSFCLPICQQGIST